MDDARPLAAGPPDTYPADPLAQVRRHWWLVAQLAGAGLGAAVQVTVESTSGGNRASAAASHAVDLDTEA
jgi:hypothetical protein